MGETQGVIHCETKFLSCCEPVKPDNFCTSKYGSGTGIG